MPTQSTYTAVALPSDGTTIDAADVTTDLTGLINEYNLNIGNSKIDAAAAIDFSKLAAAAWTSYTPTLGGFSVGNGTLSAHYIQIGKIVIGRILFQAGTTSSFSGVFTFTLPVTHKTVSGPGVTIGPAFLYDNSAPLYNSAVTRVNTSLEGECRLSATGTAGDVRNTIPWTWGTSDRIDIQFTYEAA